MKKQALPKFKIGDEITHTFDFLDPVETYYTIKKIPEKKDFYIAEDNHGKEWAFHFSDNEFLHLRKQK